ncbi:hypothetical protein AB0H34_33390 [Saccharopolyspora shandongensis]|uniref:hypothetical protein n=1 Tax=Saccharopolyspora shandongensis TaxID=418495 RepID=UPI0033D73C3E
MGRAAHVTGDEAVHALGERVPKLRGVMSRLSTRVAMSTTNGFDSRDIPIGGTTG